MMLGAFTLQAMGLVGLSQMAPKMQIPVGYGAPKSSSSTLNSNSSDSAPQSAPSTIQVRCPFDFTPSDQSSSSVSGMSRISRHASLWSFASFSLGTALTVSSIPQSLCLAAPVAVAAIGGAHNDYRFRRGMGGKLEPKIDCVTSNVPFLAMLQGKQDGGVIKAFGNLWGELKEVNAGLAVLTAVGFALRRGRGI